MKTGTLALLFLLFFAINAKSSEVKDCAISETTCDFYLCMESKMKCGYNGFPLRIGYRFCNQFKMFRPYSKDIQAWLPKTRSCIQRKLSESGGLQCNQLAWASVEDHVECYVEEGYCSLKAIDRKTIRKFILKKFIKAPKFFMMNTLRMLRSGCYK